jgi:hypothetical protein
MEKCMNYFVKDKGGASDLGNWYLLRGIEDKQEGKNVRGREEI